MKYHEKCECCGHVISAYTMPMNEGHVKSFIKFCEMYLAGGKKGIKKGDIGLTNAQYTNFQNLRYFGIIRQNEKGNEWFLTQFGAGFYYGEDAIKSPCAYMNGNTVEDGHPAWQTHGKPRAMKMINDIYPTHYKQRPEYREEKSSQESLFNQNTKV